MWHLKTNLRIYVFVDYFTIDVSSYAEQLTIPEPISSFKTVQLERHFPNVKDDAWVRARQDAEKMINDTCNEVIMYGEDQVVTEGLSSNVFIVNQCDKLQTTPTSLVLPGTMRSVVIDVARSEGLIVEESPFTLQQLLSAKEVFVCSTSRIVVCGKSVDGYDKQTRVGERLRAKVEQAIDLMGDPVE